MNNEMPDEIYLGKDSRGEIVSGEPCFEGELTKYVRAALTAQDVNAELLEAAKLAETKALSELCCFSGGEPMRYKTIKSIRDILKQAIASAEQKGGV